MKKLIRISLFSIAVLMGSLTTHAATLPSDSAKDAMVYSHIVTRVAEIQAMDKTALTLSEKKDLKKELNQMKKQASGLDQKVYLSVGAIIIIILLLILIL